MRQLCTIISSSNTALPKDLLFGCRKRESSGRRLKKKYLWTVKDMNNEPTCADTCAARGMHCVQLRGKHHVARLTFSCGRGARGTHQGARKIHQTHTGPDATDNPSNQDEPSPTQTTSTLAPPETTQSEPMTDSEDLDDEDDDEDTYDDYY